MNKGSNFKFTFYGSKNFSFSFFWHNLRDGKANTLLFDETIRIYKHSFRRKIIQLVQNKEQVFEYSFFTLALIITKGK